MRRKRFLPWVLVCLSIVSQSGSASEEPGSRLAGLLGSGEDADFARATVPRRFEFPRDHGPHPEFRNEWWYVTGNLDSEGGRRFGFELTIFRFALTPYPPEQDSAWRSNQVYIAHLAVTDADRDRFYVAERFSRGALGLAGAETFRVWIDDWQIGGGKPAGPWRLTASSDEVAIDVSLAPLRPPVLNGVDGLSQKSAEPGNASYYYSMTRLGTEGVLSIDDTEFAVSGLSWMDREWSTSALGADQAGWDWFALQLSDGSDLMFYNLRKIDGSQDVHSAGTLVKPGGEVEHLAREDVDIRVSDTWTSPAGGAYPSRWQIDLPRHNLELRVEPVIADQELFTTVRYWEGAVDVDGERAGRPLSGRGYVELTGYADNLPAGAQPPR